MTSMKRILQWMLCLVLMLGLLPVTAQAATRKLPEKIQETAVAARVETAVSDGLEKLTLVPGGDAAPNATYLTRAQAAVQLRQAMVNRSNYVTIYVEDESSDYEAILNEVLALAMAHTGNPKEGDYLLNIFDGVGGSVERGRGFYYEYTFNLELYYLTTSAQEQQVNTAVTNILRTLNVGGQSDYRKAKAVFDWMTANISLTDLEGNDFDTAFSALVMKKTTAHGFAAAYYRLMLELGVDNRMIYGVLGDAEHAWNIVKLGKVCYNVDASRGSGYDYFLRNSEGFADYARYIEYMTTPFHTQYPMAQDDYVDGVAGTPEYYYVAGYCGDNVIWAIDRDRQLTLVGEGATDDLREANSVESFWPWKYWLDGIDTVVVEEGITTIGTALFYEMNDITAVFLPDSVTVIKSSAIGGCDSLKEVYLGDGLKRIEEYAFQNSNLESIDLPEGLEYIGDSAFSRANLKTLVIPDSVTEIGWSAFASVYTLEEVTLGTGLEKMEHAVFQHCSNLRKATLPEGMTFLPNSTFAYCSKLTEVVFPSTLEKLGWHAFAGAGFTELVLPDSLVEMDGSFYECRNLTKVTLGAGMTVIPGDAFSGCSALKTVIVPGTITAIGNDAFSGTALEDFPFAPGLLTIGDGAFSGTALKKISLPRGLQRIGSDAFRNTPITEVTIPSTVTFLGGFQGCASLKKVTMENSNVREIDSYAFYACRALEEFTIPSTVEKIGPAAFQYCSGLKEMYVPSSVTTFQSGFPGCTSLETVYLANRGSIPGYGFSGCTSLKNVYISENITWIEPKAFMDCLSLEVIHIPARVTRMSTGAFERCGALKEIYFHGNAPTLESDIFHSVTATAYYPGSNITWTEDVLGSYYGGAITWVPMHDHSYQQRVVAPGCTSVGYTLNICDACGVEYRSAFVDPTGHDVVDWEVIREATCTEPGEERRGCRNCDFGETREIPMLPHTLNSVVTEPTCTEDGFTTHTCTVCGYTYTDSTVPALGHDFCPWYYTEDPTCLEPGQERRDCARCGLKEERMALPLGHDFRDGSCTRCDYPQPTTEGLTRLSGANRYLTGFAVAEQLKVMLGMERFGAVVVAYGQNFPDALTGSYLAAVKKAPILLTEAGQDANVLAYLEQSLIPGGRVYILGGTAAVTQEFEDQAAQLGYHVIRLKGKSRYETNLAILAEAGVNTTDEVLIATGTNYADSLSASATGLPMLLVADSLTADQKAFLETTSRKFVILGGTGAVSRTVENQLNALGTAVRVKGASRYETSVEIAKRYFLTPGAAVLAYAQGFPDGLCGGPLALSIGAPLILTSNEACLAADDYVTEIPVGVVTGGTGRISDETVREIFDLPGDTPIVKP